MFTFQRISSGPAEVWEILVAKDSAPKADERFGKTLRYNARRRRNEGPSQFHQVGVMCAISRGDEVEFLLSCKAGLSEKEERTLLVELELLLGREVYATGSEKEQGWFLHDTLKPHSG